MNQVFAGGLALLIALILWSTKKQFKLVPFSSSQKDSFSNTQVSKSSLIKENTSNNPKSIRLNSKRYKTFSTKGSLNSKATKKELTKLISSHPDDRLLAIQIANEWKNAKALPFLKRGLKDSERKIVIAAAAAMSSYKGKTSILKPKSQASRPPRNVFLMR